MNELYQEQLDTMTPEQRMERRAARTKARRERQRRRRLQTLLRLSPIVAVLLILAVVLIVRGKAYHPAKAQPTVAPEPEITVEEPVVAPSPTYLTLDYAAATSPGDAITSTYALLVDAAGGRVLIDRSSDVLINPASMTKVMTILTAADYIDNLSDTIAFTKEMSDYAYIDELSIAGFMPGERVTVADLLYGTILPSGADAAMGLAVYVAGSEEDFMVLVNEKMAQMGLSPQAHFTNCSGKYDENHRCSLADLAIIMDTAMRSDLCRQVLSAHTYTTSLTSAHPEGLLLSNWFLRRIEDKDTGAITVTGGKTGYVHEAGSCAVSYGEDASGHGYICVTGDAQSAWLCIYDHAALYRDCAG